MSPTLQTIDCVWLPAAIAIAAVHAWAGGNIVHAAFTLFLLLTARELVFHVVLAALHPLAGPPRLADLWRLALCLLLPMVYTGAFVGVAVLLRNIRHRLRHALKK